ncbi:MAG: dipeptide epimerase [Deltaproteobacteria bacterium]|nr:MAG: dipeptide epimerase [Deltaproteobacteria bacterium]
MTLKHVEIQRIDFRLREPYTIAYETVEQASNLFLRLEDSQGRSGWGCAAPDLPVTGETVEAAHDALEQIARPLLLGADPLRSAWIMEQARQPLKAFPSVRAAMDMALHDLLGQRTHLPVYKLLGGFRTHIVTSITVGLLPVQDTVEQSLHWVQQGFRALKIKGGHNVEEDIERMKRVREAVGATIELRFDANQGYSLDEAIRFVNHVESLPISMIEQPTPRDQQALLAQVKHRISVPLMADESLMNLNDAFQLASHEQVDMLNIKLMKVGGIANAMQVNAVARAAQMQVMVGCMDEAALGIAAGLHFALARPNVGYADLDGHLDLLHDPTQSCLLLKDGFLYPVEEPGLGWNGTL